jgi:hypothetical protein
VPDIRWLEVSGSKLHSLQRGFGKCTGCKRLEWRKRKLWPEIHRKSLPNVSRSSCRMCFDFKGSGFGKKILVWQAVETDCQRSVHNCNKWLFIFVLIHLRDKGRNGSTISAIVSAPFFAQVSASSLPACPTWAFTHCSATGTWDCREFNSVLHSSTRDDEVVCLAKASRDDLESETIWINLGKLGRVWIVSRMALTALMIA